MASTTYTRLRAWAALALTVAVLLLGALTAVSVHQRHFGAIYNAFVVLTLTVMAYCFIASFYEPSGSFGSFVSLPSLCLAALLIVFCLGILAYPACTNVAQAVAAGQNHVNLKQIGLALHGYHDKHGHFPPAAIHDKAGKPLLSWRVAILPYLEHADLYRRFRLDEPWDSPHNLALLDQMPNVFAPPAYDDDREEPHTTYIRVYMGPGAAFEGKVGTSLRDFKDGSSETILVVISQTAVPWTKPAEVDFPATGPFLRPRSIRSQSHHYTILFADGSVRILPVTCTDDELRAVITRNGGEPTPRCLDLSQ